MNLKNYFNEIKHFLKENADDPENLGAKDTGEPSPESEDVNQGEGDDSNNIAGQQNSAPAPVAPDQGGDADQQAARANPSDDQDGNADPKTDEQQGDGESGKVPSSQEETKKFGTILDQLKGLLDAFEQAKKAAGFETIDDVKKAAQENPAANSGGSTNGAVANTGGGTPPA